MSQIHALAALAGFACMLSACSPRASDPGAAPPPDDTATATAAAAASLPRDHPLLTMGPQAAPNPGALDARPSPGKPAAPVRVSAEIHGREALVTVVVAGEGHDLEVSVRGIDGVTVVRPNVPVRAASASAGDRIPVDVSFSGDVDTGALVVEVQGVFAGRALGAVRTFDLGPPPPKEPPRTDSSGRPIVILPAE